MNTHSLFPSLVIMTFLLNDSPSLSLSLSLSLLSLTGFIISRSITQVTGHVPVSGLCLMTGSYSNKGMLMIIKLMNKPYFTLIITSMHIPHTYTHGLNGSQYKVAVSHLRTLASFVEETTLLSKKLIESSMALIIMSTIHKRRAYYCGALARQP